MYIVKPGQALYVAENLTKHPLTRGFCLREVSVSGGLTVVYIPVARENYNLNLNLNVTF